MKGLDFRFSAMNSKAADSVYHGIVEKMMTAGLRKLNQQDIPVILSWTKDAESFYKWSADRFGTFHPVSKEEFLRTVGNHAYVFERDGSPAGFFALRVPEGRSDTLRIGYVILDPGLRGKGLGKTMILTALQEIRRLGKNRAELGVFADNLPALNCYISCGFIPMEGKESHFLIQKEKRTCTEMEKQPI